MASLFSNMFGAAENTTPVTNNSNVEETNSNSNPKQEETKPNVEETKPNVEETTPKQEDSNSKKEDSTSKQDTSFRRFMELLVAIRMANCKCSSCTEMKKNCGCTSCMQDLNDKSNAEQLGNNTKAEPKEKTESVGTDESTPKKESVTDCPCPSCRKYVNFQDLPACGLTEDSTFVPLMRKGVHIVNPPHVPTGMIPEFFTRQLCSLQQDKQINFSQWVNVSLLADLTKEARDKTDLVPKARVRVLGGSYFSKHASKIPGKVFMALFQEWLSKTFSDDTWKRVVVFDEDMKGFTVCY
jgi:hypothetical protein